MKPDIPVFVDSFIVFSAPKGQFIRIDDRYHREKHCFRTGLNKKIENYLGCAYYKADQLEQLGETFSEMEANVKRFETELNYDEVRRSLAEALAVLQDAPEAAPEVANDPSAQPHAAKVIEINTARIAAAQKKQERRAVGFGYAIASVFAGLLVSGAAAMLAIGTRRL